MQLALAYHDGGEVLALEAIDGQLQGFVERRWDPLSDETVQVDGTSQELRSGRETLSHGKGNASENALAAKDQPERGAASAESRSGWRGARECWCPGSYSRSSDVCLAGDWGFKQTNKPWI